MTEFIISNKEWIFSGIGAFSLGLIITLIRSIRRFKDQRGKRIQRSRALTSIGLTFLVAISLSSCVSTAKFEATMQQNALLAKEMKAVEAKNADLSQEIRLLRDSNALASEFQSLREKLNRSSEELATLQKAYQGLKRREIKLQNDMKSAQDDEISLARQIEQLKKENRQLEQQLIRLTPSPNAVGVIAPSVSTSLEARRILTELGWYEKSLRYASGLLVVIRSMLFNPLMGVYSNICELQKDAENQLNISGESFHIYIFSLDDDLRPMQVKHVSYKAND